jgi:hypothetical protein
VVPRAAGPGLTAQYVLPRIRLARSAAGFTAGPVALLAAPQPAAVIVAASIVWSRHLGTVAALDPCMRRPSLRIRQRQVLTARAGWVSVARLRWISNYSIRPTDLTVPDSHLSCQPALRPRLGRPRPCGREAGEELEISSAYTAQICSIAAVIPG